MEVVIQLLQIDKNIYPYIRALLLLPLLILSGTQQRWPPSTQSSLDGSHYYNET